MSVINKMLRDLDQRQLAAPALRQGVASVPGGGNRPPARRKTRASRVFLAVLLLLVVVGLAGFWASGGLERLATLRQPPPQEPTPAVVPVVRPESVVPPEVAITPPLPVASAVVPPPPVAPRPSAESRPITLAAPSVPPAPRQEQALLAGTKAPLSAPTVVSAPESARATAVPPTPVLVPRETPLQRQQLAAKETIANAQVLWSSGSRDAAIALLQEAVASAERSASPAQILPPLVRELAQMQLAEARLGAVWELLTRLEPQLRHEADLWAVRANAAQRLGHHQDSVQAYRMALQSRPTEQRWLLGAAVSLAALGQTDNASELADQARASGPIRRDVLQYLRQMGVSVKD